jgi:hypothetical protein
MVFPRRRINPLPWKIAHFCILIWSIVMVSISIELSDKELALAILMAQRFIVCILLGFGE